MRYVEDFSDDRLRAWCIHCGATIANTPANRDHVPTRSLLTNSLRQKGAKYDRGKGSPDDYLPQVLICKQCNSGFSTDETYLLCVLHAVMAGSLYPDKDRHPEAADVLRSNRHIVRSLKAMPDGQLLLFADSHPFVLYPDMDRIRRVITKNARGHIFHEIGDPLFGAPSHVSIFLLQSMDAERRRAFEAIGDGADLWPEVGSRMMVRLIDGEGLAGGWVDVEPGRYRYATDWSAGLTVRTVIWDYLATETHWET